jgi:hypothetical protein
VPYLDPKLAALGSAAIGLNCKSRLPKNTNESSKLKGQSRK